MYSDGGGRKKRATDTESVPGDQSMVTLSGLDSEKEYTVSVAAQTVAGVGDSSDPQSAPSKLHVYTYNQTHPLLLVYK